MRSPTVPRSEVPPHDRCLARHGNTACAALIGPRRSPRPSPPLARHPADPSVSSEEALPRRPQLPSPGQQPAKGSSHRVVLTGQGSVEASVRCVELPAVVRPGDRFHVGAVVLPATASATFHHCRRRLPSAERGPTAAGVAHRQNDHSAGGRVRPAYGASRRVAGMAPSRPTAVSAGAVTRAVSGHDPPAPTARRGSAASAVRTRRP